MLAKLFSWNNTSKQTLKITMLGHTGVGKTSLLAAIYDQFDQIIGRTNLELTPNENTKILLDRRLEELKNLVGNSIKVRGGIRGDQNERSFVFDLGKTATSPSIQLLFQDYPGGYIGSEATAEQKNKVENFIKESVAVIVAIDTPVLMEMEGQWHEELNTPQQIYDLFKAAYRNLDSPRLVILAPVKCEKYLQENNGDVKLLSCIREKYTNLLSFFSADALLPNVAVVVTPVQTVGSVVFSRIEEDEEGEPSFYFRKVDPNQPYKPRNSEQPLRYLLRFVLKLHLEHRQVPIINSILNFFGKDTVLKEAVREFASDCKTNEGCAVLQGANLLRIKE